MNQKKWIVQFFFRAVLVLCLTMIFGGASRSITLRLWSEDESWVVALQTVYELPRSSLTDADDPNWQVQPYMVVLKFLSGPSAGSTAQLRVDQLKGTFLELIPGREYLLMRDQFPDGAVQYSIGDRFRLPWVVMFLVFICGSLVAAAGESGLRALLGLGFSLFFLIYFFLPAVVKGWSPVVMALVAVTVVSLITVTLVVRRRRYWAVALLGSLGGCLAAFLLGHVAILLWQLTGLNTDSALVLATMMPDTDMRGIFLASVIIGATGAVHDVAISISAAMAELEDYDQSIASWRLWQAGLNVGRETLGTMVNTLVLAYFGSSLFTALLISQSQPELHLLLNDAQLGQEMVQSLAGTLGLLLTIPITAATGAWLLARRRKD